LERPIEASEPARDGVAELDLLRTGRLRPAFGTTSGLRRWPNPCPASALR